MLMVFVLFWNFSFWSLIMIIGKINFFGAKLKDRRAIKGVMGNEKG